MKDLESRGKGAISAYVGVFVLVCIFSTGLNRAQEPAAEDASAGGERLEMGGDAATAYPALLEDPSIELEELQLRLVPLRADELSSLAAAWQEHAREASQEVVDLSLEIRVAEGAETGPLRERRLELLNERALVFEKFSAVISSLEAKGGDPADVAAMRGYLAAVREESESQLTLQEFSDSFLSWLFSPEGGVGIGIRILIIAAALFGLIIVARIVRGWARRLFSRAQNLSKLLIGFLTMAVYWLTIAFGLMIVLAALGVNITPLFALVGGASFIIAFALQETLGNLAAGLMIMINRPFDEGDYVQVAGLGGTVNHVSVVSTKVTTPDNQVIVIPNSRVWGDVITNVTASETRRVDLVFGIGYEDSIAEAQKVLEEVVAKHPLVLKDPAPVIRVNELAESSVNFIVRPWAKTSDYWSVYWDLQRAVKEAFDANGISIPFPQTDMHIHMEGGASLAAPSGGQP